MNLHLIKGKNNVYTTPLQETMSSDKQEQYWSNDAIPKLDPFEDLLRNGPSGGIYNFDEYVSTHVQAVLTNPNVYWSPNDPGY